MANNPILPVQTLTLTALQTSVPVRSPVGTEISVAITSGTCTVDYTYSSLAAVQAGTATWVASGIGAYSASTSTAVKIWKDCFVRVVCSAGAVAVTVDPQGMTVASTSSPTGEPGASNLASMQAGFDAGTPTQQAAFQSSVSGYAASAVVKLPAGAPNVAAALTNTLRAIRQAASHKHCVIVIDSDSTSNGLAATTNPIYPYGSNLLNGCTILGEALRAAGVPVNRTRWVGQMGQQTLGSSNGLTDPRVSGVYTETMNSGIAVGGWQTITVGNKRSYTVDAAVDRAQLIFITNSGSTPGTITVDVNGGAALYSFSQAIAGSTKVSAPINLGALLKPGDVINVNATIGTVFECGVMAWNSHNPGVTLINNGASGKSAQQGAATGGFNARSLYAALATAGTPADLVMVSLLLNSLGDTSVTYQGYLQTLYATIKAAASASDVLFFDGPQCAVGQANSANWPTRQADAMAVAAANSCVYISTNSSFGASPGSGGGSVYYIADNVGHMTPLGYEEYFRAIAAPIVSAVRL